MDQNQVITYIYSDEFSEQINKISKAFSLHIDQEGTLYGIVQLFFKGFISGDELIGKIKKEIDVNTRIASLIAQAIDEEIIKPLKQKLVNGSGADEIKNEVLRKIEREEESVATLSKKNILEEIENPTPTQTVTFVSTQIPKDRLTAETPKETAEHIIEEALTEANAHTYNVPAEIKTPQQHVDLSHRIKSHEDNVVFLPMEHVELDANQIIPDQNTANTSEQKNVVSNTSPQPITQKKRPLSDIIPPGTPRKYGIDPYREPIE